MIPDVIGTHKGYIPCLKILINPWQHLLTKLENLTSCLRSFTHGSSPQFYGLASVLRLCLFNYRHGEIEIHIFIVVVDGGGTALR